jgi:hypothetical protein
MYVYILSILILVIFAIFPTEIALENNNNNNNTSASASSAAESAMELNANLKKVVRIYGEMESMAKKQ